MKCVVVNRPVRNVDGIYKSLKGALALPVISVGSDTMCTYVYLDDQCEIDPSDRVMSWQDPPELMAMLDGEELFSDGISKGRISIIYGEPFTKAPVRRSMKIRVRSRQGLKLSASRMSLRKGNVLLEVGPVMAPVEDVIELWDPRKRVPSVSVRVRFTEPPPLDPKEVKTEVIPKVTGPGAWKVFRRLLRI